MLPVSPERGRHLYSVRGVLSLLFSDPIHGVTDTSERRSLFSQIYDVLLLWFSLEATFSSRTGLQKTGDFKVNDVLQLRWIHHCQAPYNYHDLNGEMSEVMFGCLEG